MDPEAAENICLRRWRRRVNGVGAGKSIVNGDCPESSGSDPRKGQNGADEEDSWQLARTVKGLWGRLFKKDKRLKEAEGGSGLIFKPSINSYPGRKKQLKSSRSMPTCEPSSVHEDVGALHGAFLSNALSVEDAAKVPLPVQSAQEECRIEVEPSSSIIERVSSPVSMTASRIDRSLSFSSHRSSMRTLSPDWFSAPTDPCMSLDSTTIESSLGSEPCADSHSELINSIEHFRFTALVNSSIIENVHDVRAVIDMISGNLLNVAPDL
jgi:hypothetical protein